MTSLELDYEVVDSRFAGMIQSTARVDRLYDGCRWAEGPVWFADRNALIWSDIPNERMLQWVDGVGVGVFRQPSNFTNGNTRDREGRLVSCEHGRRVTRTEHDGSITIIADSYKGKRLNSPNDVVVKSDGTIWFTDPPYGILTDYEGHKSPQEQDGCYVYRVDPSKNSSIEAVVTDLQKPNGIAFSLDESVLYVVDTGATHDPACPRAIHAYPVKRGGRTVGKGKIFCELQEGAYDGFRLDTDGNIWTSAGRGVNCYAPDGALLGRINMPEVVSNVAFGGPRRNRLFMTATTSLYALYVFANGAQRP
jgi:gluconolactonase